MADGEWTMSSRETLEVLLDAHFPGCLPLTDDTSVIHRGACDPCSHPVPLSRERISWALRSFEPFKSPGPDGIIPADLQRNEDLVVPWLYNIYNECFRWAYIPTEWTKCRVVFIPKSGKASHAKPKDFRPISLVSFLLKALERIVDIHLRMTIPPELLSNNQHAYTKGRSVETALHTLVGLIEGSFRHKEYALVAFLDIEGAFNNVNPSAILDALEWLGVDNCICRLIKGLLGYRVINAVMGGVSVSRVANRGTPQGGVLSPLLWNVTINTLLVKLTGMRIKTIAYADDVAVVVTGKFLDTISRCMELALSTLSDWSVSCGLGVNPLKTELVLFTRRYKVENFAPPRLNGISLQVVDSARYLGIVLDRKLSWNLNIQYRVNRANVAMYSCKRAVGASWGIGPAGVNWIFKAVVKPILFYGVVVWWSALENVSLRTVVGRVLRTAAVLMTGAMQSTPSKALFVMLNWLPVELMAKQLALNSALRLKAGGTWTQGDYGHAKILEHYGDTQHNVDYCISEPFFDMHFTTSIPERDMWSVERYSPGGALRVFTDGSRRGSRVGGGFYIERYGIKSSFRLPDGCSVLQAEVSAIKRVACWIRYYRICDDICIFTDSKAAIKTIAGVFTTSRLTRECRASLNGIAEHSRVELVWVPAHGDCWGNCIADDLAKKGTMLDDNMVDTFIGTPLAYCKLQIARDLYQQAQNRWFNEITCGVARALWPVYDASRTRSLIGYRRERIRILVSVLTGHCVIGIHARRLGLAYNDYCRSCQDIDEEENVSHLLCQCSALATTRERILGSPYFSCLEDLSGKDLRSICLFIRKSGWFGTETAHA